MARARLLKPGFFSNEALCELHPFGRLLFAGLWTLADREGRLPDRPKVIKGALFPYENVPVDRLLGDLDDGGFIMRYEVEGERYIQIVKFKTHQHVHKNEAESVIPSAFGPQVSDTLVRHAPVIDEPVPVISQPAPAEAEAEAEAVTNTEAKAVVEAVVLPGRRNIFVLYDHFMGAPSVTGIMRDVLIRAEEEYPDECITHCFEEAAKSSDGRRNWKFVESILLRHKREGCDVPRLKEVRRDSVGVGTGGTGSVADDWERYANGG